MDYEAEDLISILKQSSFMNPTLQTFLLARIKNEMFIKGARLVAAHFGLPFPPSIIKQQFPLNLGLAFAAYRKGEMGSRDLAVTAAEMAGENPKLWELASSIVAERRGAASTLREFQERGGANWLREHQIASAAADALRRCQEMLLLLQQQRSARRMGPWKNCLRRRKLPWNKRESLS